MKFIIASLLFSIAFICNAQSIEKAKIDKNEPKRHHARLKKVKDANTGNELNKPKSDKKTKAIYLISYPKDDCHYKKPKTVILEEGMTIEQLKNLVKNEENGSKYKFNTFNYLSKKSSSNTTQTRDCHRTTKKLFFINFKFFTELTNYSEFLTYFFYI